MIFLKNICIFLLGISWKFQNIVKMLLDNIRLYFILSLIITYSDIHRGRIKYYLKTSDFTVTDLTQYPPSRSAAGYESIVSQLTRGIDPMAE